MRNLLILLLCSFIMFQNCEAIQEMNFFGGLMETGGNGFANLVPAKKRSQGFLEDTQYTNHIGTLPAVFTIGYPPSFREIDKKWMKIGEKTFKREDDMHFSYVSFGPGEVNRNQYCCAVASGPVPDKVIYDLGEKLGDSFKSRINPQLTQMLEKKWEKLNGKDAFFYSFKIKPTSNSSEYLVFIYYIIYENDLTVTFYKVMPNPSDKFIGNRCSLEEFKAWISTFRYDLTPTP